MDSEQATMLLRLQQIGLTMDDLRIYLDTHLYDDYAIQQFNIMASDYQAVAEEYSRRFTPLSADDPTPSDGEWSWALSDFPWDY